MIEENTKLVKAAFKNINKQKKYAPHFHSTVCDTHTENKKMTEWGVSVDLVESVPYLHEIGIKEVYKNYDETTDCIFVTDKECIGVEVVEFVEQELRKINEKEGKFTYYKNWKLEEVVAHLQSIITKKNKKILEKDTSQFSRLFLVIFTDEFVLEFDMVKDSLNEINLGSVIFEKIYMIFSFPPKKEGYEVLEIK